MSATRFYHAVPDAGSKSDKDLVSLFAYHLTVEMGRENVSRASISDCFSDCDLSVPKRVAAYLSEGVASKPKRYVKVNGGYRLQAQYAKFLSEQLGSTRVHAQTSVELRQLEVSFPEGPKKSFLRELIDCFEAGANRASIVMCWIMTMDHLLDHIETNHMQAFNLALGKSPAGKLKAIVVRDDFSDLKESKIIELCRSAGIISNDVRKILDEGLGVRNTAAHPSAVVVSRSKVIAVIEDLVRNVVLKY